MVPGYDGQIRAERQSKTGSPQGQNRVAGNTGKALSRSDLRGEGRKEAGGISKSWESRSSDKGIGPENYIINIKVWGNLDPKRKGLEKKNV